MIYTVTLNPALDRFIVVEQLLTEDTTRILSETAYAAGNGINVSRVIRELGGHSVALGLVGGYEGLQLEGSLINAGVMSDLTRNSIYSCFNGKKGAAAIFGRTKNQGGCTSCGCRQHCRRRGFGCGGICTGTFPGQRPYGVRSTILRRWDGNCANTRHGALSSHGC